MSERPGDPLPAGAGRAHTADAIRPVAVHCRYLERVPGSVLYASGCTRVLATAVFEDGVPEFLEGRGSGWATAEYDMLPAATNPRRARERGARISGRTQEIQRLIGRALRAVLDLQAFPGRTLRIDCDVLQADGGTRTAAINGAWIAAALAVAEERRAGRLDRSPILGRVSAVSVGVVGGKLLLDLDREEDSRAEVDLNVAMTESGELVEVQGTAERSPFGRDVLLRLLDLAERGILEIRALQAAAIERAAAYFPGADSSVV